MAPPRPLRFLSGQDDGFLHLETDTAPMNSMAVGVLRPAVDASGDPVLLTREGLRDHMARRLGELPSLRWRIEPVPLRLAHPVAIEDPDFDLDYHVRHAVVAAPGGPKELDALVESLGERHHDRRHPLWQITLVDGLADGRQAVVYRVHHCLQDGAAAFTSFSRIFSGDDHVVAAPAEPWVPDEPPTRRRLVAAAMRQQGRGVARLPELLARTRRGMAAAKAHEAASGITLPKYVTDTPLCSLNDAFTIGHTYARSSLPLEDVKLVKNAAGVSLNDVVLALVAAALRRYLVARDDLPARPLVASVPVGFEAPDAPARQYGNRFTSITTSLATDVEDPWGRLRVISRVTSVAKECLDLAGPELMADWLEAVPPFIAEPGIRSMQRRRRENRDDAEHSVVVSNLKGPAERWRFGSAEVEDMHIQGPPSNGVGPNIMLWSYGDRLNIGVLAFADAMADPHEFAGYLADALNDLVVLAEAKSAVEAGVAGG